MKSQNYEISNGLILAGTTLVIINLILVAAGLSGFPSIIIISFFSFFHGMILYSFGRIIFFLAMIIFISWSYEILSINTGFPFGSYFYSDILQPQAGSVPLLIMPAYFAMGYLSWVIALIIFGKKDSSIKDTEVFFIPLTASFVMLFWDLCMDPVYSTIEKYWVWPDGGDYFGVPVSNFMGWFICTFTFYMIFALYLKREKSGVKIPINKIAFWVLPVLMYLSRSVEFFFNYFFKDNVEVSSVDGKIWQTGEIYSALAAVTLFTMVFVSLFAIFRIHRNKNRDSSY